MPISSAAVGVAVAKGMDAVAAVVVVVGPDAVDLPQRRPRHPPRHRALMAAGVAVAAIPTLLLHPRRALIVAGVVVMAGAVMASIIRAPMSACQLIVCQLIAMAGAIAAVVAIG